MASLYTPTGDDLPKNIDMADIAQVHHNLTRNNKRPEYILYNGMNHYNGMKRQIKNISRPRARAARSGSESPRITTTKNKNNEETETHDKSVGKDEQVKCKQHRARFARSVQTGKGTLRQRLASLARSRQNKPKKRRIAEKQVSPSSLRSLGVDRITESPIDDKSKEQKRQNDDDKEEQNKKKKRIINREMKQVEEKILLDISDSQFKKRKQMNTEEQDKEERRQKWKSHDK